MTITENNQRYERNPNKFNIDITGLKKSEIGAKIIRNLVIERRLKMNKPEIMFVTGASGEGKSYAALKIAMIINEYYGIDTLEYLNDMIIYTPLEFSRKVKAILSEKRLKKLHVLIIDEARETVKASLWNSTVNRAISDISAMARSVKPLVVIVISQSFRDVDKQFRYTVTHYCEVSRPDMRDSYLRMYRAYQQTYDIDAPKLRKSSIVGILHDGERNVKTRISSFRVSKIPPDLVKRYEEQSFIAKHSILVRKMDELQETIDKDIGKSEDMRMESIVEYYKNNPEALNSFIARKRGKTHLDDEFRKIYKLNDVDAERLQEKLIKMYEEMGYMAIEGA